MAKGFDNLKIKSAVKAHNKFDLSNTHLTTMDFGQIVPLYTQEMVPGDKFNINANFFSRMAPLAKPTYGKFQFKTVAGFVPAYQIADDAEAFLAGKSVWEGKTPHLRNFQTQGIIMVLNDSEYSTSAASDTADYMYFTGSNDTRVYKKLTAKGKFVSKVLCSLGYSIPQNVGLTTSSSFYQEGQVRLNAMPLLAFAKLYNDYMSQSQRYNVSVLTAFLRAVRQGEIFQVSGSDAWIPSSGGITVVGLKLIFENILLCYENDYFTSAWQQPNTPLNTLEQVANFSDSVLDQTVGASSSNLLATYRQTYGGIDAQGDAVSQRALDFLQAFDNWVRRNNYSGSRAVQQIYSRFGIKTEDYRSNYAHVISTDIIPVQVGDITSQASTSDALLGDYAGKGIVNGQCKVSYDASDYGYLFILGYYTITPMNAFGFDRSVLRYDPLDFFNPEFDAVGPEAISYKEIYTNPVPSTGDTTRDSSVFGFTERYNSYKFGRDKITGDFRQLNTLGNNASTSGTPFTEMSVWHTGRILNNVRAAGNMVAQSSAMNTLPQVGSEYNRIFADMNDDYDKFYLTCQFNVSAVRPMVSLNQAPRLGEGDTNVPRNGNVIS